MSLWTFVALLAALSVVMVVALVEHAKAFLAERRDEERMRAWGWVYALLWIAIISLIAIHTDAGLRAVIAVPAAFIALQLLILWFGNRLRLVTLAEREIARSRRVLIEEEPEEEEEEEQLAPPPPPPTLAQRIAAGLRSFIRWVVTVTIVLAIIGVGENIDALHRLDAALLPHRPALRVVLPALVAIGFAMFMGGVLSLLLRMPQRVGRRENDGEISLLELKQRWHDGTWRDSTRVKRFFVVIGGVALAILAGAAMAVVFATPGIKLLVMLVVGFAVVRVILSEAKHPLR
ncbi:MAG TPA: hypothetical protein VHL59_17230 [Thermoanaerobaculia bacterium]|nr:hypothetical protein [Thermoanaerobaculia bacterium]